MPAGGMVQEWGFRNQGKHHQPPVWSTYYRARMVLQAHSRIEHVSSTTSLRVRQGSGSAPVAGEGDAPYIYSHALAVTGARAAWPKRRRNVCMHACGIGLTPNAKEARAKQARRATAGAACARGEEGKASMRGCTHGPGGRCEPHRGLPWPVQCSGARDGWVPCNEGR